jgi:hypothetical protein
VIPDRDIRAVCLTRGAAALLTEISSGALTDPPEQPGSASKGEAESGVMRYDQSISID